MDQIKFVEDRILKIWSDRVCLGKPDHFEFFKDCLQPRMADQDNAEDYNKVRMMKDNHGNNNHW